MEREKKGQRSNPFLVGMAVGGKNPFIIEYTTSFLSCIERFWSFCKGEKQLNLPFFFGFSL